MIHKVFLCVCAKKHQQQQPPYMNTIPPAVLCTCSFHLFLPLFLFLYTPNDATIAIHPTPHVIITAAWSMINPLPLLT